MSSRAYENYEKHRIGLASVRNARELGGYVTKDGRRVKSGSLIRCGHLAALSEEDEAFLREKLSLSYVIDMRSEKEQELVADKAVGGARHINISFLEEVTSERADELDKRIKVCRDSALMAEYLSEYASLIDMSSMYVRMVKEQMAIDGLRSFFSILLRDDASCVIWHCRSGKDRSGIAAALLLYALGCSIETIKLDYCTSNAALADMLDKYVGCINDNGYSQETADRLAAIVGVDERNIEIAFEEIARSYGDVEAFLYMLGLGDTEVKKLREKYLIE